MNSRRSPLPLIVIVSLVAICACALAQQKPAGGKQALITITKTDGTTVRGQLVSSDPDRVVLKPAPKPGQKDAGDDVTIAWTDIKAVSNGLTQAKALDAWKQQHRAELCETCRGDRTVYCDTCRGTQHDPASAADCKTCKGELVMACKTPKCDNGTIVCPQPCVKLTQGRWVKQPDGSRRLTRPDGSWVSEGHLGELWVKDPNSRDYQNKGKCPTCGGTTTIADPACRGVGKVPCPTCLARKDAPPCPAGCEKGRTKCAACDGSGLKKPGEGT